MVTFADACDLVDAAVRPTWRPDHGTFYVDRTGGFEDAQGWLVRQGAREWLVDEDWNFCLIGGGSTVVDKRTGRVDWLVYLPRTPDGDRIDAMTPYRATRSDEVTK